jgi:hypothetical protein
MRCLPKPSRGRFFLPLFARVRGGRFSEVCHSLGAGDVGCSVTSKTGGDHG